MRLQPNQFMADWELAERIALKRVYPLVDLRGCWFHYCNAIRKRRQKMGLKFHKTLKFNQDALLLYTELQQIPLLPAKHIEGGFRAIKQKAELLGLKYAFGDMFTYFENYWLNVVSNYEWLQITQILKSSTCFRTLKTQYR